jgi:hypothetical protein
VISSIEELLSLAFESEYVGDLPLEVAKKLFSTHEVAPGVVRTLALVGLAKKIGDAHHEARTRAGGSVETVNKETKEARRKTELARVNKKVTAAISRHIRVLRDISFECNGRLVGLYAFTRNDIQNWIARSEKHATGWARRAAWFHSAEKEIVGHKKGVVGELPDNVLKRLAAEAEEAWKDAAA